ncbi:MAG TPA: sugar ABC transporter ATP-binding protein [Candidatus Limnocylindrales bacterium]|nr:sugar ABC transporter ATP-binding protein [Candidatus Limnocylindrales bacterium]
MADEVEPSGTATATGAPPGGLVLRGVKKWYGDTHALDGLDLDAPGGSILGVAGPNGAGKSTMIKVLAGEVREDSGAFLLDGAEWRPMDHRDRVAVVHQEPQLFPNLTVAENLMIGREGTRAFVRGLDARERALMKDLAILDYADRPLGSVPLAMRQRVEIGRALARDARVFLFDEPNSALTQEESSDLFRRMHQLADGGAVVILVSHRIAELAEHAARVALILDGRCTGVLEGAAMTQEGIAAGLVTGQTAHEPADELARQMNDVAGMALRLAGWTSVGRAFTGIDLDVHAGEIVAIVGVEGSGGRELVRSIAGFERSTGSIDVAGRDDAATLSAGTGLVSADRAASLFGNLSIADNMVSRLDREITTRVGALRRGRMAQVAIELRKRFGVKASSLDRPINSLSGGNQQKVAISAAVVKGPKVLVLEEPTRGVDIASKREIYRILRALATDGHAVIMFCTEVPEVFEAADLAYVMSDGQISAPLVVTRFEDVEALARAITRLERHARVAPAAAVPPAPQSAPAV